jgi:hypothetical protein
MIEKIKARMEEIKKIEVEFNSQLQAIDKRRAEIVMEAAYLKGEYRILEKLSKQDEVTSS